MDTTKFALTTLIIFCASVNAAAQHKIIVGAFKSEARAKALCARMQDQFQDAGYDYVEARALYYVHALVTRERGDGKQLLFWLRDAKGLQDAWIYTPETPEGTHFYEPVMSPKTTSPPVVAEVKHDAVATHEESGEHTGPRYVNTVTTIAPPERVLASANETLSRALIAEETHAIQWRAEAALQFTAPLTRPHALMLAAAGEDRLFTFVVEDPKGRPLNKEVMLVDFETKRRIQEVMPGQYLGVRPSREGQMIAFVCDALGYAQELRMINLDHVSRAKDVQRNADGVYEVRIQLRKMPPYDIVLLHDVSFHDDAAILERDSEQQLAELLTMMQENPNYRIIVHSHTNENGSRRVAVPDTDDNFFNIDAVRHQNMSAKKLSLLRARQVRDYLVARGISPKRVGAIGWGTTQALYALSTFVPLYLCTFPFNCSLGVTYVNFACESSQQMIRRR